MFATIDAAFQFLVAQGIEKFKAFVAQFVWDRLVSEGKLFACGQCPCVVAAFESAWHLLFIDIPCLVLALLAEAMRLCLRVSGLDGVELLEPGPCPFAFASGAVTWHLLVFKRIEQLKTFVAHARLWLPSMAYVPKDAF